jgi:hypothetical protein
MLPALAGCVDYLEHRDTVTLRAGDAQAWNRTVHTADPWPPHAMNNDIMGDGPRTARVIQRYSTGNVGSADGSVPTGGTEGAARSAP